MTKPKLRHPYEYVAPLKATEALLKDLRNALKPFNEPILQCVLVSKKAISKGIRLNVFLLGAPAGYSSASSKGISPEQWQQISTIVTTRIQELLGETANVHIEPWCKDRKFSISFVTYIQYTELL